MSMIALTGYHPVCVGGNLDTAPRGTRYGTSTVGDFDGR